jgi:hypothetical protein
MKFQRLNNTVPPSRSHFFDPEHFPALKPAIKLGAIIRGMIRHTAAAAPAPPGGPGSQDTIIFLEFGGLAMGRLVYMFI